jgi:hypothetical protein
MQAYEFFQHYDLPSCVEVSAFPRLFIKISLEAVGFPQWYLHICYSDSGRAYLLIVTQASHMGSYGIELMMVGLVLSIKTLFTPALSGAPADNFKINLIYEVTSLHWRLLILLLALKDHVVASGEQIRIYEEPRFQRTPASQSFGAHPSFRAAEPPS